MNWYDVTQDYHNRTLAHGGCLSSLPEEWQRELAALWRLEADVNNGGYLQFLVNWGHESYVYASRALKKIGALTMAAIIDRCQALVDEHFIGEGKTDEEVILLLPDQVIGSQGEQIKEAGSLLPDHVTERILAWSYEFMDYPDDVAKSGILHYGSLLEGDDGMVTVDSV